MFESLEADPETRRPVKWHVTAVLFLAGIACAAEKMVSFDDLVFEQIVSPNKLIEVKTKCVSTGEVIAVSKEVDPCEPDPYVRMCKEANDQNYWMKHLDQAEKALSLNGEIKIPPLVRKEAQATVNESVEHFLKMLRASRVLQSDLPTLEKVIRTCTSRLSTLPMVRFQGVISAQIHPDNLLDIELLEPGTKINPTAAVQSQDCELRLSARFMVECAERTPACYWLLFHELSHMLDSCRYLTQSKLAENSLKFVETEKPGPVQRPELESVIEGIRMNQAISSRIGLAIQDATSPLEVLSQPRNAVPNRCTKAHSWSQLHQERCGKDSAKQFPTQWAEAEADFWSASAFAVWLESKHPETKLRKRAFKEVAYFMCEESGFKEEEISPNLESLAAKSKKCEIQANRAVQPATGWSSHPPTPKRFNRNLLRNADLRNALGCKLSSDIPMAASPLGKIESVLIK